MMRKDDTKEMVRSNIHVVFIVNKVTFLQFKIINNANLDIDQFVLYNKFRKLCNGYLIAQTSKGKV